MGLLKLFFIALSIQWAPPSEGSATLYYDVHIVDSFGQTVELVTTNTNSYTFSKEGRFKVSVRGYDEQGRVGEWSEWSNIYLTDSERLRVFEIADHFNIPPLAYISGMASTFNIGWVDPHENNE